MRVPYSAKNLIDFLGCEHCSALDLQVRAGELAAPGELDDPYLQLLIDKGHAHERAYLETLRADGKSIREIERVSSIDAMTAATRQAMRDGVDVVYQGALAAPPWHGYSDFLLRVDTPSKLGDWSYEVADTKLARSAKPKHVMQLCVYARLIEAEQGLLPQNAYVVLGDGNRVTLRLKDYIHYVDAARERFRAFATASARDTAPEPCAHCDMCRWRERCDSEWESADHLSLVARLGTPQARKLRAAGVATLRELAELDDRVIPKVQAEALNRLKAQARLQLHKRTTGENKVETLPLEARKGFARLPQPSAGDLFFDMEGDPVYSPEGGLEYLFGFHYQDDGVDQFTAFWARDRASEKKAFEDALDFITARIAKFPHAYVYHYASYETTAMRRLSLKYGAAVSPEGPKEQVEALKRLAQQHGTRENEVDDLLRDRRFVDLYKVVREGIRVSEPRYSLKNLEVFFAPRRTEAIQSGGDSIVAFERWVALGDDTLLKQIEEYNAFDCRSTRLCRDWLLTLRPAEVTWLDPSAEAAAASAKEKEEEEKRRARDADILDLRAALVRDVPEDERGWRELLGYLLEYHRREARSEWWEFFKRLEATVEELVDDNDCIGGLTVDESVSPWKKERSMVWTLSFPEQETKMDVGDVVRTDTGKSVEIVSVDMEKRRLELKLGPKQPPIVGQISLVPGGPIQTNWQRAAIQRYAEAVIAGRADDYSAVTGILHREKPRPSPVIAELDASHLVVQGPPGAGKTYTSARAIVDLMQRGKRVGVTALSHKAINNLLHEVEEAALERGVTFRGVKKVSHDEDKVRGQFIVDTDDNDEASSAEFQLVGGTAWLFSRDQMDRKLDFLFVDEAGQMSLADVVAVGVSARNIVLVGDQMQLAQPSKGAHPGGSGVSALEHLMGDWATVPPDRGILLAHTWRMHPDLCRFVSERFYNGHLEAAEVTALQRLVLEHDAGGVLRPAGLRFVEVDHEGNTQRSVEEAERVDEVYRALLGQQWVNQKGETGPITAEEILVVSPYNMQVNLLRETLPAGARVGTVDKFQGQEAAVVLISLAASSGENIPRGVEFLFSRNRLNVAISRARCLSVVFASPALLATTCRSVPQVGLVDTLCQIASTQFNRPE